MTDLPEIMAALGLSSLFGWVMAICGLSALLAAVLPPATRRSPRWWRITRGVIDRMGANVWHAKNRTP